MHPQIFSRMPRVSDSFQRPLLSTSTCVDEPLRLYQPFARSQQPPTTTKVKTTQIKSPRSSSQRSALKVKFSLRTTITLALSEANACECYATSTSRYWKGAFLLKSPPRRPWGMKTLCQWQSPPKFQDATPGRQPCGEVLIIRSRGIYLVLRP